LLGEDLTPYVFVLIARSVGLLVAFFILLLSSSLLLFFFSSSLLLLSVVHFIILMDSFLKGLFSERHFWLSFELLFFGVSVVYFSGRAVGITSPKLRLRISLSDLFGRNFGIEFP
jgi:hypothetical protein